jgi:ribosomal protein S18 acetylase RimI-like enzyme
VILRDATPADAARVGEVHYRARAEAYPGLLPAERVNTRTLAERQKQWLEFLEHPGFGRDRFLVAFEGPSGLAGFSAGGPQRHGDEGFPGEVWSIYLLREWRGRGHGRALMAEMARRLHGAGYPALIVWTQPENVPARGFYERLGGVHVRTRPSGGFESVGYGWKDIRSLFLRPPKPPHSPHL